MSLSTYYFRHAFTPLVRVKLLHARALVQLCVGIGQGIKDGVDSTAESDISEIMGAEFPQALAALHGLITDQGAMYFANMLLISDLYELKETLSKHDVDAALLSSLRDWILEIDAISDQFSIAALKASAGGTSLKVHKAPLRYNRLG